ncbi:class I SAM-dependent methyltransferase [Cohnella terricola]|uniref:Methyltransferase domain-containing protein n=1 Tax=Cohnella terricola TaxID=1289167 RepID=A0A559JB24_9BACL|nr:class I SAM-dependent methyltransferase [Cohnella terricola]TVX97075.1 methyltransferase domain-containing protein [Cohnella terricola]
MINYPDTEHSSEDLYDIAYKWGWETEQFKELVFLCYKTPNFSENAHRFYESEEFASALAQFDSLGKPANINTRVLDFGCGNGVASYSLARAGYTVVGIDSSLGEIAGINAASKIIGLDGVHFTLKHSQGEKLEFEDESFDIIWMREVLHHIKDLQSFLTDLKRILKPGGIICCLRDVVIWNEEQREHFFDTHPFYPITKDEGCYYLDEYIFAFKSSGLALKRIDHPYSSPINTYPSPYEEGKYFDSESAKARTHGYDLYSFIAVKENLSVTGKTMNNNLFEYKQNYYGSVILNPKTMANICTSLQNWFEVLNFHHLLASDDYVEYLDAFYRESIKRFGDSWEYMDIVNVLYGASKVLQPKNYLEIGVRRGRSVCTVVRGCPDVNITAFDMWISNYAGMDNPGPDFVQSELKKHNHRGNVEFINGDSHVTVPDFLARNPEVTYDMITVDGDHSEDGAFDDLCNVIPRLAPGGVLVFDDISHPAHPYLIDVWRRAIAQHPFLVGYEFTELGYGVAFAIRKGE